MLCGEPIAFIASIQQQATVDQRQEKHQHQIEELNFPHITERMSVYNKNAGHGVTGSFNTYVHPKTKIGNFVEDTIGRDLVDHPRQTPTMYETCAKSSYTEPSMRKSHMGPNEAKFSSSVKLMTKGMKSSTIL